MPTVTQQSDGTFASGEPGVEILRMEGISKSFGPTQALRDVELTLRTGEVHALMGENGAGKSTLMKVLSGVHQPDGGRIVIDGKPVGIADPRHAQALGIAIIHQELNTVPEMSIAENLALGAEPTTFGMLDRRTLRRQAVEKLARVGVEINPTRKIGSLSVGLQQMIEIARALAEDARIIIMDEPTASLSEGESHRLFELVDLMRAENRAVVYISHRMEEVWRLADRITVFRDGAWVSTTGRDEITPGEVVNRMVGREITDLYTHTERTPGDVVLQVVGLGDGRGVGPVDLQVRAGEVVTMGGLVGAGRTEIARMIVGADPRATGTIRLRDRVVPSRNPGQAIKSGIALLPESRKDQALFLDMSVSDNLSVADLDRLSAGGVLRLGKIRRAVRRQIESLRIKVSGPRQPVSALSGGNQQKVVLGRWLEVEPQVLILDEPTRGVDIGAKHEIYRLIDEMVLGGAAVLVISSDLPEALGISDRVLVVREGRIVADLPRADATEESVMMHATGIAGDPSAEADLAARIDDVAAADAAVDTAADGPPARPDLTKPTTPTGES